MKSTKLHAIALLITFFSIILFSCKKDEVSTRVGTEDNSNSTASIKTNLVAWYKFTNGNTADFSGKNNHLTAYNVTKTTDYMGRPNNAYYFDGFSSYMMANDSPSLSPSRITIAALIKPMGYYNGSIPTSRILMKEQMINRTEIIF
jgi:hypothetical protein